MGSDQPRCIVIVARDSEVLVAARSSCEPYQGWHIQLLTDTRMARARIGGGDVELVLAAISENSLRGLPLAELRELASGGEPPVVAMCCEWSEQTQAACLREGAAACVPATDTAGLRALVQKYLDKPLSAGSRGRVAGFIGAKGGAGTTTLALESAAACALDRPVILVDAGDAAGTLRLHLNPHEAVVTTADLVSALETGTLPPRPFGGLWSLEKLRTLQVLFAGKDRTPGNVEKLSGIVDYLAESCELVILDLGLRWRRDSALLLRKCDALFLAVERDAVCLQAARQAINEIEQTRLPTSTLSVCLVQRAAVPCPLTIAQCEADLQRRLAVTVPPAPELCYLAQTAHSPAVLLQSDHLYTESITAFARHSVAPVQTVRSQRRLMPAVATRSSLPIQ